MTSDAEKGAKAASKCAKAASKGDKAVSKGDSGAGKGDIQRSIPLQQEWDHNYERIFGVLREDWPKCNDCKQPLIFDEEEQFADCNCGTSEWGEIRPENWKGRQRHHLRQTVVITDNDPGDENDSKT